MTSLVEHHIDPPIVEWYCDGDRDAVVVMTTITAYTILYLGHPDATVAPPIPIFTEFPEFL